MAIFKRGKTYWFNFWWDGHHVQRSTRQGNPRVARQIEAAYRTRLAKGEVGLQPARPAPTFQEFASQVILPWAEKAFAAKPKTFAWYRGGVRRLLECAPIANPRLDEITGETVAAYVAHRLDHGLSVTGINRELQVLRRVLLLAVEWGRTAKAIKIKMLPGERPRDRVLTSEEEVAYLMAAPEPLKSYATLLVDSGLRPEEASRLRWEFVNFDNGLHGTVFNTHGKTKAARRLVPMTPRVREILRRLHESANRPTDGWVFPAPTKSGHAEPSTRRGPHRKALAASRVRPFVFYTLRHTFFTRLGEANCDPWTMQQIGGWKNLSMSARYVHPNDDAVQRAFNSVAEQKALPAPAA